MHTQRTFQIKERTAYIHYMDILIDSMMLNFCISNYVFEIRYSLYSEHIVVVQNAHMSQLYHFAFTLLTIVFEKLYLMSVSLLFWVNT